MRNSTSFLPVLGYLLGACLFGWLLFFYNRSHANNGYDKVNEYVNNTESVKLTMNNYKTKFGYIEGKKKLLGGVSYPISQTFFYDNSSKKYFVIELVSGNIRKGGNQDYAQALTSFIATYVNNGQSITAEVNKIEMVDTSYGTKNKPIPIFKFKLNGDVTHKTLDDVSSDKSFAEDLKKIYVGSIGVYLSYIKSKSDFDKMFGKAN